MRWIETAAKPAPPLFYPSSSPASPPLADFRIPPSRKILNLPPRVSVLLLTDWTGLHWTALPERYLSSTRAPPWNGPPVGKVRELPSAFRGLLFFIQSSSLVPRTSYILLLFLFCSCSFSFTFSFSFFPLNALLTLPFLLCFCGPSFIIQKGVFSVDSLESSFYLLRSQFALCITLILEH